MVIWVMAATALSGHSDGCKEGGAMTDYEKAVLETAFQRARLSGHRRDRLIGFVEMSTTLESVFLDIRWDHVVNRYVWLMDNLTAWDKIEPGLLVSHLEDAGRRGHQVDLSPQYDEQQDICYMAAQLWVIQQERLGRYPAFNVSDDELRRWLDQRKSIVPTDIPADQQTLW
jgi:hypothetical protein